MELGNTTKNTIYKTFAWIERYDRISTKTKRLRKVNFRSLSFCVFVGLVVFNAAPQAPAQIAFALTGNYPIASNYICIAVADVNGDAKPDLIVGISISKIGRVKC